MLRLCCILLLVSTAAAQVGSHNKKSAWDASYAKQAKIRQHGTDALERQRTQGKTHLCQQAGKGEARGKGIADRLSAEFKGANRDYLVYELAIGELLQLPTPDDPGQRTPKGLSFDVAEESWQRYRDQTCTYPVGRRGILYRGCRLSLAIDTEPRERVGLSLWRPLALLRHATCHPSTIANESVLLDSR